MEGGLAGDGKEVSGPGCILRCPNMALSKPDEPNLESESVRPKETRYKYIDK